MKSAALAALTLLAACAAPHDPGITTSADGVSIRYDAHGEGDTLIVLIHGWVNNRTFWDPHPAALARTHRVAALDLAGFGESGSNREDWTMRRFAEDVVAVVNALDVESVVLVGFSMGSAVALEAATLLGDRTVGVVIVDDLQDVETRYSDADMTAIAGQMRAVLGDSAAVRAFAFSPQAPDSLARRLQGQLPTTVRDYWWQSLESYLRWRTTDLAGALRRAPAPIAAINSDGMPTDVEGFRKHAPSFRLYLIPGVGHLGVLWEKPGEFDRLLLQAIADFRG